MGSDIRCGQLQADALGLTFLQPFNGRRRFLFVKADAGGRGHDSIVVLGIQGSILGLGVNLLVDLVYVQRFGLGVLHRCADDRLIVPTVHGFGDALIEGILVHRLAAGAVGEGDLILGHLVAVRYRCVHFQHAAVLDTGLHGLLVLDVGIDRLVVALNVREQPNQTPTEEPSMSMGKRPFRRLVRFQIQRLAHIYCIGLPFRLHGQFGIGVLLLKSLGQHVLCFLQGHAAQILPVDLGIGKDVFLPYRAAEHQIGDEHHSAQTD